MLDWNHFKSITRLLWPQRPRRSAPFEVLVSVIALAVPHATAAEPIYTSTSDTVFDIITHDDPSSFVCLQDKGRGNRQMWDKRADAEFNLNAYLFDAYFSDGPRIEFVVNPEFPSAQDARREVQRYTRAFGQLPPILRQGIRQVGIHKGQPTYSAGPGKIFLYADRTTLRIAENRLEESLLHESVHASLDATLARSPKWQAAQRSDGQFLTRYGQTHPVREDLAETMLFAYALAFHPDRLPPVDSTDVRAAAPARLDFLIALLTKATRPQDIPHPPTGCNP